MYFDRTDENTPSAATPFTYQLNTGDLDIQYHFPVGNRQNILLDGGFRFMKDKTNSISLNPENRTIPLSSGFVQDEIGLVPDKLKLILGSKIENNVFTGNEMQPSARLALTPRKRQTLWVAISRAVRTPSRFDEDVVTAQGVRLTPQGFQSEKVLAYELGYRVRPLNTFLLCFATFYNQYKDLRSLNAYPGSATPVIISNGQNAETSGFEFSANYQAQPWWRLRCGYTFFNKNIYAANSAVLPVSASFEGVDPANQAMFQSIMALPKNVSLDITGRFVDGLHSTPPIPSVPAYISFDVRLALIIKHLEIAVVGQNLSEYQHIETGVYEIPRSIYAKIIYRY